MQSADILLGGTAREPEDVRSLYLLGLDFAEVPITDIETFLPLKEKYRIIKGKTGFFYLCHGPREGDPNDIETLEKSYLTKVQSILDLMPDLDMQLLTLHLWMDPRFVRKEVLGFKIDVLRRILERAAGSGITVCLENLSETDAHLASVFDALPQLRLTLDVGHAALLSTRNNSYAFMRTFPERIRHLHLHDNRGGVSVADDLHLPPGEGVIDFAGILRKLRRIPYRGTITLELRPREISSCLRRVRGWLRQPE
jgi:sugar phosphate isomerase/epimerase